MGIPRELIDPDADKVVRRLSRHGHKAYLVGGCVRDLLLEREPKDFDVSTSATPKEIRSLFRNCRIIGRRFTLAHIFFGPKIIETSTFRANPRDGEEDGGELLIRRDNVFGSDTEDARRRDFTINGLFYDVEAEEVIDHVDGLSDLEARIVRTIGDPDIRFREDPVRMLRAVKFAARLGFRIGDDTFAAILRHRSEISKCAPPRVLEEVYRLLRGGAAVRSIELLIETGLIAMLSTRLTALVGGRVPLAPGAAIAPDDNEPELDDDEALWTATWAEDLALGGAEVAEVSASSLPAQLLEISFLEGDDVDAARQHLWKLLEQIDRSKRDPESPSNSALLAIVCLPFVMPAMQSSVRQPKSVAMISEILRPLVDQLHVARRDAERARQLLLAYKQLSIAQRKHARITALLGRETFSDALYIYELDAQAKDDAEALEQIGQWRELGEESGSGQRRRRRRRRRGGRGRRPSRDHDESDEAPA